MRIVIKDNKEKTLDLYFYKLKNIDTLIVRDIDYLNSKVLSETKESLLEISALNGLGEDLIKQLNNKLKYEYDIKDIKTVNTFELTDFLYITDYDILVPFNSVIKNEEKKTIITFKFKNVLKDFAICTENEPCKKRREKELFPFDACCSHCELNKECDLVCTRKNTICFSKKFL